MIQLVKKAGNAITIFGCCLLVVVIASCQDKDYDREAMVLSAPDASQITGSLSGDDYTWTWPSQNGQMQVTIYRNGTLSANETVSGNSFTQKNVPTNVPFEYVFKVTDGTNFSTGVIKTYTREGATSISGLQMSQVDKAGGYDALVEWNPVPVGLILREGRRCHQHPVRGYQRKAQHQRNAFWLGHKLYHSRRGDW